MFLNTITEVKKRVLSRNILSGTNNGILIAFIVLIIALSLSSPSFLTVDNITNVTRQAVFIAIIAFAATFVIGMGGIDLSVGANLAFCGIITGDLINHGVNIYLAIIVGMLVGMAIGFVNGLLIVKMGITDFIATLAMMIVVRGIVMVYTHGIPIAGLGYPEFQFFGQSYLATVPMPVIITILVFFLCYYLMYWTRFGRYTLSIGSNAEAARLVGINISKMKFLVYSFTGLLAGLSGMLLTSRLEAAMPDAGQGYELDVIAAVVIGGTSLSGGKASLVGTAIGAVLMAVVRNGLNLLNINTFWHQVVIGIIIAIAVSMDKLGSRKSVKTA